MINIAICDDIFEERENAINYIKEYSLENNILISVFEFCAGEDLLSNFEVGKFSIVLLDIFMKKLNGIETAKKIRELDQHVEFIFATSSRDYAADSYGDIRAIDYIVKPYSYKQMSTALSLSKNMELSRFSNIEVISDNAVKQICVSTIKYVDVFGKVATIHTVCGDIKTYTSLEDMIKLFATKNFYRCHRSSIINFEYIKKNFHDYVIMSDDEQIGIARGNIPEFKRIYTEYLISKTRRS